MARRSSLNCQGNSLELSDACFIRLGQRGYFSLQKDREINHGDPIDVKVV